VFERFTQDARNVVVRAQEEARRLGHPGIGTSHLLLALISGGTPTAALLVERGVTHEAVSQALAQLVGTTRPIAPRLPADEQRAQDAEALAALGIDLDRIREAVEAAFGPGALDREPARTPTPDERARTGLFGRFRGGRLNLDDELVMLRGNRPGAGHIPFGADAKKTLELSLREALRLGDRFIGVEHVLLGLLRASDSVAVGILGLLGVDTADLRRVVEQQDRRRSA
jgi:ATP-dependent Clp protease ATP-binding subunit ClpA